ncbi:hypothetical protein [Propionivibrio sp.]|uniref:hypothetical protein n=1 Tax=Propionivibrio sp. TaxID=2212460 RepID=UPI0026181E3A|nr:hypothetical protein [Propionivibrio sp.]
MSDEWWDWFPLKRSAQFFVVAVLSLPLMACGQATAPSAYNPAKASLLSEEKRREYDIQLANELATWNTNTTRCNRDAYTDPDCRENFFRQLAADGYEIADIVSQIYFPKQGVIKQNLEAYERLHQLAEAGDKSALCFAPYVLGRMGEKKTVWPYTGEREAKYTRRGVALGLPLCAINEFYAYWNGVNGYPKDHQMAHQRLLDAAKAGLFFAQMNLSYDYEKEGFSDLHTIRKALCWGRLADQHSPSSGLWSYANSLRLAAWDPNDRQKLLHPEFMQLAKEWDPAATPHHIKHATIEECIQLEEKKEK